jgi:glycosyltransferase involved in cell wall biosynthesis
MLRVKNEARWIERVIASLQPVCNRIVVMDDHSTDGTPELLAAAGVEVFPSPFETLDEARDKNWLLDHVGTPDWIVSIDGDEILTQPERMLAAMDSGASCLTHPVFYLWDREDQYRVDGVYGLFRRHSAFRPTGAKFPDSGYGGNFHCGNVPVSLRRDADFVDVPLLHLGYLHREDRIRKYGWYNQNDPNNQAEDCYRHMVQGDIPEVPADARLMHGGPLQLVKL